MTQMVSAMTIIHTIFMFSGPVKKKMEFEDSDKQLRDILSEINHYLYQYGNSPFFLTFSRAYFQKCVKSWLMVGDHLDRFLLHPRKNYSYFMQILDHEMARFPEHSFYGKQLRELAQLIARGPDFKDTALLKDPERNDGP